MAPSDFKPVDEYLAARPEAIRPDLERARLTIRKAVPEAGEEMSYRLPAYRLQGDVVLYFAGWKTHYSLYPAHERVVRAFKDELAPYELSRCGIRLPLSQPVPVKLIDRIARLRAKKGVTCSKQAAKQRAARKGQRVPPT